MKAIRVRYLGPTNSRGARYVAEDCDGNRAVIPYDYASGRDDRTDAAAIALCRKMGWDGTMARGHLGNHAVYVWLDDDHSNELRVGAPDAVARAARAKVQP